MEDHRERLLMSGSISNAWPTRASATDQMTDGKLASSGFFTARASKTAGDAVRGAARPLEARQLNRVRHVGPFHERVCHSGEYPTQTSHGDAMLSPKPEPCLT